MNYLLRLDGNKILGFHSAEVGDDVLPDDVIEISKELWDSGEVDDVNTFIDGKFSKVVYDLTAEEKRRLFKGTREENIKKLSVVYDGVEYDADEVSQDRLTRAIISITDPSIPKLWVSKDNSVNKLTKNQLIDILALATNAQDLEWIPT